MIVIADTSVILNLCCVQQEELLRALFQKVAVPPEVRIEFERATSAYPRFSRLTLPSWVREQQVLTIPESLRLDRHLDAGEVAAISLAVEMAADAILIDEKEGRRAARDLGLITIGVAGVLVRARLAGLVPAIAPVFKQLEEKANFWLAPGVLVEALRAAGEI